MMRVFGLVFAVAVGGLVVAGSTETVASAFSERKQISIDLCTSAVAKRTGNSNLWVYQSLSRYNKRTVWIEVRPERWEFKCTVVKNGPGSYFIQTVMKL